MTVSVRCTASEWQRAAMLRANVMKRANSLRYRISSHGFAGCFDENSLVEGRQDLVQAAN